MQIAKGEKKQKGELNLNGDDMTFAPKDAAGAITCVVDYQDIKSVNYIGPVSMFFRVLFSILLSPLFLLMHFFNAMRFFAIFSPRGRSIYVGKKQYVPWGFVTKTCVIVKAKDGKKYFIIPKVFGKSEATARQEYKDISRFLKSKITTTATTA